MPASKKYPDELRERAVRMVFEIRRERGSSQGVVPEVARKLGIGDQSLRLWVRQAEIDDGQRPGTATVDAQRIAELERENRELRRANEILKAASAFFASMSGSWCLVGFARFFAAPAVGGWWLVPMCGPAGPSRSGVA